jgi:hypothetical protein
MVADRILQQPTAFEVPVSQVLTDPDLHGLAGELAIRAVNIVGRLEELSAAADSILTLTEPRIR